MLLLFVLICIFFTACEKENVQKSRERWLKNGDEIVLGLAYPAEEIEEETHFLDGVNMALDEVNEKGILGKKVTISKADDEGTVTKAADIAQTFSNDPKISAVIGHWYSKVSNAVSDIYNRNGMVMISPASTSADLTAKGYDYIFTMINDDMEYADIMVEYAIKENLDRVVIYYVIDDYGRGLANNFEDAAFDNGIDVVDRISSINNRNIDELIRKWNALDYNAIIIAASMAPAEDVIRILKQAGIEVPILGATSMDKTSLITSLDIYAEDIVIPTLFNPTADRTETKDFVQKYIKTYGYLPDSWAAQGYDSIKVLCKAMEAAGSAIPDQFAKELRKTKGYQGVSGELSCNDRGEITTSDMYIKLVHNKEYIYTDNFELNKNQ